MTAGQPPTPEGTAAVQALREHVSLQVDGLTADEEVSNAAVLMFGGIDTTESMIANLVLHLLERPAVLAAVRADRTLLSAAIEESLRLEPAASVVDRYATQRRHR